MNLINNWHDFFLNNDDGDVNTLTFKVFIYNFRQEDNASNADTTTAAPTEDTTTTANAITTTAPAHDGAATIVINIYLMVLSLYVMLK